TVKRPKPSGRTIWSPTLVDRRVVEQVQGDPRRPRGARSRMRRLTFLLDRRVIVPGGVAGVRYTTPTRDADAFDPGTGTFPSVGPMREPRSAHSATLLDDGRVAIIGGVA